MVKKLPIKPKGVSSNPGSHEGSSTDLASDASTAQVPLADAVAGIFKSYAKTTPSLHKLLDIFLAFVMATGVIQALYMVVEGSQYPYNAFLASFGTSVGMFVLTAGLRVHIGDKDSKVSFERYCSIHLYFLTQVHMPITPSRALCCLDSQSISLVRCE